jgi:hypothetical protein
MGATAASAAADVGFRDYSFTATDVVKPSGQKPQSKLWFNDGIWWANMFEPGPQTYSVHRLDPATQHWVDTGTQLDARNSSDGDTLWDGAHLYVASASDLTAGGTEIRRLSYSTATKHYTLDAGFPVTIPSGAVEAAVLDKDSGGRLWVTYTSGNTAFVAHTNGVDSVWGAPYALPVDHAADLDPDDISAIVSYAGRIGVMWSNQNTDTMYFASHVDGAGDTAWSEQTALGGPLSNFADDHINLKSIQSGPGGRVYAAVKTSKGDGASPNPADPLDMLLIRNEDGTWTSRTFGTVANDHTRPIVVTDQRRRALYMFATSPTSPTTGPGEPQTIYYKKTSLDSPSFAPGLGTVFMHSDAGFDINDATSTKQDIGSAPGLVVLAADDTNYWHNVIALPGTTTGTPPGGQTPAGQTGGGQTGGGTVTPPVTTDRTRPRVLSLSVKPSSFRTVRRGSRRPGATVRWSTSERGSARFRFQRAVQGRRVGGRCVATTRRNRSRRSCTRWITVRGSVSRSVADGQGHARFSGKLRGRRLASGAYRVVLVVTDAAGNASAPRRARFRIIR